MARPVQNASIAKKLTWMNMLVSGAALVIACASFIAYDMITFRDAVAHNLSTQAQIIGSNSASALLFNDPQAADTTLSALSAAPDVLSAVIYTPDGQPLATYLRNKNDRIPVAPALPSGQLEVQGINSKEILLVRSIVFKGRPIGTVYIRSDLEALNRRLVRYAGIAGVVLLASLLAALLVSSIFRRAIAKPIADLVEVAGVVSHDKDYSIRATPTPRLGELSILIDAFNEMLTQIDQNERDLRKAHDGLEHRVRERTAELQAAKDEVEAFSQTVLRAKEELERASKFKDQFLSTMSHELRTPLNAVLGFSDLLTEERYGPLNDRQRRYINHIHTGGTHLLRLINDILDLSKIEAGRLHLAVENVPVSRCFAEALDTLRPLADKKSQTFVQHPTENLCVRADATRFKQILMNLVGNAIKFTPEHGTIELAAKRIGAFVRVEVRDSGPGIPHAEQKRIFEAFYRLSHSNKAPEGTGLGLAITQRLVQLHGGELSIESETGSGSSFFFTLPIVASDSTERPQIVLPQNKSAELPRILVVEDDPAAAHLIKLHLISVGYDVLSCDRPNRAVEMAAELQPAAITMDIVMKPINGWELLLNLKTNPRTSQIPVIVITILDQPTTGVLLGADEYIIKPVQKPVLLAALDRCLNQTPRFRTVRPILVVEDDTPTREFLTELLSKNGYLVRTASDGEEARSQIAASVPELVILDLNLPKVSGFQLLAEWSVDSRLSDLPVFVLTSKDLTEDEKEYIRAKTGALFQKQEPWQEGLVKQLRRAVLPALAEKL